MKAETEEELAKIKAMEVPVMEQAIDAYCHVKATKEFKELERIRSYARHNEASALAHAAENATNIERKKWQGVVAKKDIALAEKDAVIAELKERLREKT